MRPNPLMAMRIFFMLAKDEGAVIKEHLPEVIDAVRERGRRRHHASLRLHGKFDTVHGGARVTTVIEDKLGDEPGPGPIGRCGTRVSDDLRASTPIDSASSRSIDNLYAVLIHDVIGGGC